MSTMKAVVNRNKEPVLQKSRPVPKLRDDYLLVKVKAVALNPTDWKHAAFGLARENGLLGCDFSGTVEEVGSKVTKSWSKGDAIMGVAHGGNASQTEDGAFAEYIVAKGDVQIKKPDSLSFEAASTLPLGATTVGQGLYQKALKLKLPTDPVKDKEYVLIYGGSTATGALAVQYATLSGYKVITTCSPRNFDYVKSLGAAEAFDYNDKSAASKIRELTENKLKYAWDTVSEKDTAQFCADALSTEKGCRYGAILSVSSPREDVESVSTLMYTVFGEEFEFATNKIPASSEDFEFAKKFMGITEKLLAEGKLKPHAEKVGKDGLQGVISGLEDLKSGKVSGNKLVYKVEETP
ncbi:zinc-binding oxidoreductase alcohol dehydrogenase [Exophiala viscosa]|uniref:Zinc-binding oxidoreductase alcohol dehydrogenase n=2 Tax=Exophiala viscosa TaxID=2486360 RepID=A0AAN6DXK0_9EURO|nr:zinc-binding oxidoreductase alcohol dehydrogenase [Exophiala viscosa]